MFSTDSVIQPQEQASQGKGWIASLIMHIAVLALLFLPMIASKTPPPEQEGLLVNLGLPDEGQGEEIPKGSNKEPVPEPVDDPQPEQVKPMASKTPSKQVAQKTLTSNTDSEVIAREAEAKKQAKADAQRKADEEARQQAAY